MWLSLNRMLVGRVVTIKIQDRDRHLPINVNH